MSVLVYFGNTKRKLLVYILKLQKTTNGLKSKASYQFVTCKAITALFFIPYYCPILRTRSERLSTRLMWLCDV